MLSLSRLFGQLAGRKAAAPVYVPFSAVKAAFHLDDGRYFANRAMTRAVAQVLKFNLVERVCDTRSYYVDPEERFSMTLMKSSFSDIPDSELSIRGSASITTQQLSTLTRKNKFAAMIQPRIACAADLENHTAFGITGTIEPDGRFRVEKLFMPKMEGRMHQGLAGEPVTGDSVRVALQFARLCADQMFEGRNPDYFGNLFQARRDSRLPAPEKAGPG